MFRLRAFILLWLCLTIVTHAAPTVTTLNPTAGSTVSSLTSISVTFSEAVTGVNANDLDINFTPATSVTGSGAGPYIFTFTQPPPGSVSITWDADHGIAGLGTGAFDRGSGWLYTLNDTAPPTIATITTSQVSDGTQLAVVPTPSAIVSNFTQAEVNFSEPVTGVDAADLLVNGSPTTSVTGSGSGPYVFTFTQPVAGAVNFTWAVGHNIKDLANNGFNGSNVAGGAGTWSVTRTATALPSVVINEFMAANAHGLIDENGDHSDWIEIRNTSATVTASLLGWSITDDPDLPGKWVFPSRSISPGGFLVIFASGKDRKPTSGILHTNFTLGANGGYVGLFPPTSPRTATSQFPPNYNPTGTPPVKDYPSQRYDYSYGPQSTDSALRYFATPTVSQTTSGTPPVGAQPTGATNGTSTLTSITPNPNANVTRGFFKDPFSLILTCTDAGATIRYTLDGSVPTASSTAYTIPLNVTTTTVLRMAAFDATMVPSETVTHSYLFLDSVLNQPSPPYDDPTLGTDDTNPPLPTVSNVPFANGGIRFPITWGNGGSEFTLANMFVGNDGPNNIAAGKTPADYGMDPEILNDANKYDDTGAVNAAGITNLTRVKRGLREYPILSVVLNNDDMFGASGIYSNPLQETVGTLPFEKPCSIELLLPDGTTAIATTCSIRVHGNGSRNPNQQPKHGFKLNFSGRFGASSFDYGIFSDSPSSSFDDLVLRTDYNYSWLHWDGSQRPKGTLIRDPFCKDTFRDMGQQAGHGNFVHLFINGLYWGIYNPTEQENQVFGATYFGGNKDDYDSYNQAELKSGTSTAYTAMTSIGTTSSMTNAQYEQMKGYLDVTEFEDYILLHFYLGHTDWGSDAKNWYAVHSRINGGTFKYLPWDMENVMVANNTDVTGQVGPSTLHAKLINNPQYKLDFADRVNRHMVQPNGALTPTAMVTRWNKWVAAILDANACETARWGDYRRDVHQNRTSPYTLYTWNNTFMTEVNLLRNSYFPGRTTTVLGQLRTRGLYPTINAPEFHNASDNALVASQRVNAGYQFKLLPPSVPPGGTTNSTTIYYTLDGSDPRVYYDTTGSTTPTAILQNSASPSSITINATTTVRARALSGATWSALSEATFIVGSPAPSVRITELHYHPTSGQGGDAAEFIEIQNTGATAVDLSGWSFSGVNFIFPRGTIIAVGTRLVIANNGSPATFASQYPGVSVLGYYGGSLDNGGERIALSDATGKVIVSVDYDDTAPWPTEPDGSGRTLEIIDPDGDPDSPFNWKASNANKGTPGAANSSFTPSTVQISEFLAVNTGAYVFSGVNPGFVELYNSGGSSVDVSGWTLVVDGTTVATLPASTVLAAGAYQLVHFYPTVLPGISSTATLPPQRGDVWLVNGSAQVVDGVHYGPQAANFSFARISNVWTLSTPTAGSANAAASVAPVSSLRLNEWVANRSPGSDDWLELTNLHPTQPVVLTGLFASTSTQSFRITAPAAIAPGGYVQYFCNSGSGKGNALDFQLPNEGTTLSISDSSGTVINSVTFGVQAEEVSQGRLPNGTGAVVTLPYQSPAAANYAAVSGAPVLNEILTTNLNGDNAPWALRSPWLELKNPTGSGQSLAGWQLRNPKNSALAWTIPAGVSISAGGYLAIWAEATQPPSTINATHLNYNLAGVSGSPLGNGVELVNAQGQIVDRIQWGKQIPDLSIGRLPDNSWALLAAPTRGAANTAAATLGPQSAVRINEWYAASVAPDDDYVELYNTSNLPVSLGGLYLSDDPSEVGREKYRIPALSYIAGNGFALFTAAGSVPDANTTAFSLSNTGEYLRLGLSDDTQVEALGFGLQTVAQSQGRQPEGSSSTASFARTPGLANVQGTGPWFTSLPPNQVITAGTGTTLSITAINATSYQWRRNGQPIGGASGTTYSISSATINDDGVYDCIATGPGGSNTSAASSVTILYTYALWAAEKGLTGPNSGPTEDKDNDGLSNLAEFFANSDPLVSDNAAQRLANQVQGGLELSGGQPAYLTLDFRLNRRASLNGYTGEMNTLLPGAWGAVAPSSADLLNVEANGDQHWHFRYAVPPGATQRFLRMNIAP